MNKKILLTLIILSMLILPFASAWMPSTHRYMNTEAIEQAPYSTIGSLASQYTADFNCGNYLADASVFYYFSEGFTSIGKEYRSTHSTEFCKRAVALAQRHGNQGELAFAYGLCSHQLQDAIAHNEFVPSVIEKTKLVNGLVHALAEEKVDDLMRKKGSQKELVNQELINTCPQYKDFFIEVAEGDTDLQNVNPGRLYDAFIEQVAGNTKYSLGFQSFMAVPVSIHLMLLLVFVMTALLFVYVYRIKKKNIFNKISLWILAIISIIVILTYILYFTGNFWKAFQTLSYPLSQPLPTGGWESHIDKGISETVKFFNQGLSYMNTIPDPSGTESLGEADKSGSAVRILISILFLGLISLFVWLNFRKKKRR
jgi:hypothetical protein